MNDPDQIRPARVSRQNRRNNSTTILYRSYRAMMVQGVAMVKFRYAKRQPRIFWVDPALTTLYWGAAADIRQPSGRFNVAKARGQVRLDAIRAVIVDRKRCTSTCELFNARFQQAPDLCVSVVSDERTIDLEASSMELRNQWAAALSNVVFGDRKAFGCGEEDDDFDDEEDDLVELEKSDQQISDPDDAVDRATSASDVYAHVYSGHRMSRKMRSQIEQLPGNIEHHRMTHSRISKELMAKDARFHRLATFVSHAREEIGADRGSLYLVDQATKYVTSIVIEGQQGFQMKCDFGQDLVGHVALTGDILIVADAYEDSRFDQENDVDASYKTTSVLLGPVRDRAGRIVAILEFRNKQDHQYTKDYFTVQHGSALVRYCLELRDVLGAIKDFEFEKTMNRLHELASTRSLIRKQAEENTVAGSRTVAGHSTSPQAGASPPSRRQHKRTNSSATAELKSESGRLSQLFQMTDHCRSKLDVDRVALFILDTISGTLRSVINQGNQAEVVSMKVGTGLPGVAAESNSALIVADAYEDPRFDRSLDSSTGYKTTSVMCIPLHDLGGRCVGVIQFVNKQDMPFKKGYFRPEHAQELADVLGTVARELILWDTETRNSGTGTDDGGAAGASTVIPSLVKGGPGTLSGITEVAAEEDN